MTQSLPDDPLSQFSIQIFTINGLLMQSGEYITRPLGQSSARWQVLGRVGYSPQTVAQMARSIGNSRQSVQRLANELAKEGLVAFFPNPKDRRAPLLEITAAGNKVLEQIYERDSAWSQGLIGKLDSRELTQLSTALAKVGAILEKHIKSYEDKEEKI